MKKFLLISSLFLIAFSVFGQNQSQVHRAISLQANTVDGYFTQNQSIVHNNYVPPTTPIVLAPQEQIIGKTKYDSQTNKSFGSRFYAFPDGRMVATWTGGNQTPPSFPDRGSFYNYFDGTSWTIEPNNTARIENERTGWPSWAPLGNGEVIASHNASTVCLWARETVGTGTWTKKSTLPGSNVWCRLCVHDGVIHLITVDNTTVANQFALYYSKSTDGGATWSPQRAKLSTIFPNYDYADNTYGGDAYVWAEPNKGIIAFSLAYPNGDLVIYKSADNGTTWEKKVAWETPNKNASVFDDDMHAPSGAHSLVIDDDGICHLTFTTCLTSEPGRSMNYYSNAFYWNETMAPFSYSYQFEALNLEANPQLLTESRLILDWSFNGENYDYTQSTGPMVLYNPFGMIHKIHMAVAGPDRIIIVLAVQDHTTSCTIGTNNWYYSRIFACSYVKEGTSWIFDSNWRDDLLSWGKPGWLQVNRDAHLNENCTHPQIVVDKINEDSKKFHIFYMVDNMPGSGLEGATEGVNNPQYNTFTDNYFVVYSDLVTYPDETPPTITTSTLPNGKEGQVYDQTLRATGTPPIIWSLEEGTLPLGLTLEAETGKITGIPTEKHILYEFKVKATNAFGGDLKPLSIFIDSLVVGITTIEQSPIMVYPNPVFDVLHIVNNNQQNMQISLFDFLGREVLNQDASDKTEIDISKLPAGIYNVRIQHGNAIVSRKVVKK